MKCFKINTSMSNSFNINKNVNKVNDRINNKTNLKQKSTLRVAKFVVELQVRQKFQKDDNKFAKWLTNELINLGPAFIKIGQFMSTRVDIFGNIVTDELSKLQDKIDPVLFEDIDNIIREELKDNYRVIDYIEPIPLATASIGQVHKAKLLNKKDIVIKVQKPDIAAEILNDLTLLNNINSFFVKVNSSRAKEFEMILTQYRKFLSNELNFKNERIQMVRFKKQLVDEPVYIPITYKALSTKKVLTMEYVESFKITDIEKLKQNNIDPKELSERLVRLFLAQVIRYGSVHCDPHPGNIGINNKGEMILFDFGNVIQLSPEFIANINTLVFSVYQKDIDEFVDILINLKIIELEDTLELLELKMFFQDFFNYLETLDLEQLKTSVISRETFSDNLKIKINQDFLSLFRVFSLIDGTCLYLNPEFNYITALEPFNDQLLQDIGFINGRIRKDISKISSYPKMLQNTDNNIISLNNRLNKMMRTSIALRSLIIVTVMIDNVDEPDKLLIIIPSLFYIFSKL